MQGLGDITAPNKLGQVIALFKLGLPKQ